MNSLQDTQTFGVIVAGSRGFQDYERLAATLDHLTSLVTDEVVLVSGGARGADRLGERWARERRISVARYLPDWDGEGRSAGYRRNERMARASGTKALVAFWDGESRGTRHMIDYAHEVGLKVRVIRTDRPADEPVPDEKVGVTPDEATLYKNAGMSLTVKRLREIARGLGLKGYSRMTKEELVDLIMAQ